MESKKEDLKERNRTGKEIELSSSQTGTYFKKSSSQTGNVFYESSNGFEKGDNLASNFENKFFSELESDPIQSTRLYKKKFEENLLFPRLEKGKDFDQAIQEIEVEIKFYQKLLNDFKTKADLYKIRRALLILGPCSLSEIGRLIGLDVSGADYKSIKNRIQKLKQLGVVKEIFNPTSRHDVAHKIEVLKSEKGKRTNSYFEIVDDSSEKLPTYTSKSFEIALAQHQQEFKSMSKTYAYNQKYQAQKRRDKKKSKFDRILDALENYQGIEMSVADFKKQLFWHHDLSFKKEKLDQEVIPMLRKRGIIKSTEHGGAHEVLQFKVLHFRKNHDENETKLTQEERLLLEAKPMNEKGEIE